MRLRGARASASRWPGTPLNGRPPRRPRPQVKILLQVKGGFEGGAIAAAASKGNLLQAFLAIGKQEGVMGYWKGNLPQVGCCGRCGGGGRRCIDG